MFAAYAASPAKPVDNQPHVCAKPVRVDAMTYRPIIHSQRDLEQTWRRLMGPLGFANESLWLGFVNADGAMVPHLTQIEDTVRPPTAEQARSLGEFLRELVDGFDDPPTRIAFLRTRPGSARLTSQDRAWAEALYAACRSANLAAEVVHLATDHNLVPLPLDELPTAQPA